MLRLLMTRVTTQPCIADVRWPFTAALLLRTALFGTGKSAFCTLRVCLA